MKEAKVEEDGQTLTRKEGNKDLQDIKYGRSWGKQRQEEAKSAFKRVEALMREARRCIRKTGQ